MSDSQTHTHTRALKITTPNAQQASLEKVDFYLPLVVFKHIVLITTIRIIALIIFKHVKQHTSIYLSILIGLH